MGATQHLQSTEYLTDRDAKVAEHNEYFAFGETWIDERQDLDNDGRQDYLFTGKELDPGTNLYYFGARYYDPQVSRWESADPVLGMYVKSYRSGGALVPRNLALYTHAYNNPLVFLDPTGTRVPIHQSPVDSFMHEAQEWYYKTAAKDWTKGNYASAVAEATAGALIQAGPTVIGTLLPVAGVTTGPVPPGETLPVTPAAPEVVPVTEPGPVATPPPVAEGAPPTPAAAPAAEAPAATPATGPAAPVSEPPAIGPKPGAKFTPEQQGLAEMAKHDKQTGGITEGDMDAYKQLNTEAGPKGFTAPGAVRGPEVHPPRSPKSTPGPGARPHGHVGPVHHIPIKTRPK